MSVTSERALAWRMRSLLLDGSTPGGARSVGEVVTWFGAMQAQDYASSLWSLGCRLPALTRADVEHGLEQREALRTWPMRGTIHLVPARDAYWMLALMGERAQARAARRRAQLGLDETTAARAVDVLRDALLGTRLTRDECLRALEAEGISTAGQRGYHLLWYASQRAVTCIGPAQGTKQTFVLLDEWVPDPVRLDRDEALATIARRYVRSHGPVTRRDFIGWTGLSAADASAALALAGDAVRPVDVEGVDMLAASDVVGADQVTADDAVRALPGFDEYLLGYKDRSLLLDPRHAQAVVPGGNGVFQATLVRSGRVIGTWKRSSNRTRTTVTVFPLVTMPARERRAVEAAFEPYARFLSTPVDVRWPG